jgi:RNA polymerase sigma-B factor
VSGPSTIASERVTATDARTQERKHEERELFSRLRSGDPSARETLVLRFMPLAYKLAHGYRSQGEQEDLEQVAVIGLLSAIDRFDPDRGLAFSTFAFPTINGELRRYFRDRGWSVRVPRSLKELSQRVDRASGTLAGRLGRSPTVAEIAEHIESTEEQVLEARQLATAHRADSLDVPRTEADGDGDPASRFIAVTERGFAVAEDAATLGQLMRVLPVREREILRLRFEHDLVQSEIAGLVGTSQMQVSRSIQRSLTLLRDAADEQGRRAGVVSQR